MIVAKFGGSSLADAKQVQKVINIVRENADRRVIVVSAPGKRDKSDQKVTDMLIKCAEEKIAGRDSTHMLDELIERFAALAEGLGLSGGICEDVKADFERRYEKFGQGGMPGIEYLDLMKAAGEDNCAKIIAAYFCAQGVKAVYVNPKDAGFFVNDKYGDAQLLPESYDNIARALGGVKDIIIFPGFFGYTKTGSVVTFSRGGSDVTGSILAAALDAELYENFTDVDHVQAVHPRLIPDSEPVNEITYREMRELSYGDFKVYHEDALVPVFKKGIPVHIKNTNNPHAPGTTILRTRALSGNRPVTGISAADGFLCIHISKLLMNIEIGFGKKLLEIIADENLPFEHMPSGIDNISVILRESVAPPAVVDRIVARIKDELNVDEVTIRRGLAIVMLVGEGMLRTVGTTARASRALAGSNINIEIINQGSSEVSLMFGIDEKDAEQAVKSMYNEFFPK